MPRSLDVDARRTAVVDAAMDLLSRGGSRALTFKALAESLGGSTTLITHIFRRKEDIYAAVADRIALEVEAEVPPTRAGEPLDALRDFLEWCAPLDAADLDDERLRFALLERSEFDPRVQPIIDAIDTRLRVALEQRLAPLAEPEEVPALIDFFRAVTNGVILSVVEHPDEWSAERYGAVLDLVLGDLSRRG